ncbi:hypothetical protein KEX41_28440 (plasmid) [Burkholderia thailandensis]|nr:hypothetical protein [Burkholderia thailandensis]MBS2132119.1 hypothetical protein [Burkholderia thailandensis]QRA15229.1 hypothetical protein JMY07_30475 [Burkholderia thailandensis]
MTWLLNHLVWVGLSAMGVLVFLHHEIDLWRIGQGLFVHHHRRKDE